MGIDALGDCVAWKTHTQLSPGKEGTASPGSDSECLGVPACPVFLTQVAPAVVRDSDASGSSWYHGHFVVSEWSTWPTETVSTLALKHFA